MSVTGYLALLTTEVMCGEFSQCYRPNYYYSAAICFWTNGSRLTQSAAQSACQERNSSLLRITNSSISNSLDSFHYFASRAGVLYGSAFWIDVKAVDANNFHWIDGSSLVG